MTWQMFNPPSGPVNKANLGHLTTSVQVAPDGVDEAYNDQVSAVRAALRTLVTAVGLPEDRVSVSVTAHANPGHGRVSGWSPEFINLRIEVAPPAGESMVEAFREVAGP